MQDSASSSPCSWCAKAQRECPQSGGNVVGPNSRFWPIAAIQIEAKKANWPEEEAGSLLSRPPCVLDPFPSFHCSHHFLQCIDNDPESIGNNTQNAHAKHIPQFFGHAQRTLAGKHPGTLVRRAWRHTSSRSEYDPQPLFMDNHISAVANVRSHPAFIAGLIMALQLQRSSALSPRWISGVENHPDFYPSDSRETWPTACRTGAPEGRRLTPYRVKSRKANCSGVIRQLKRPDSPPSAHSSR
jgi:hypothetical protein